MANYSSFDKLLCSLLSFRLFCNPRKLIFQNHIKEASALWKSTFNCLACHRFYLYAFRKFKTSISMTLRRLFNMSPLFMILNRPQNFTSSDEDRKSSEKIKQGTKTLTYSLLKLSQNYR